MNHLKTDQWRMTMLPTSALSRSTDPPDAVASEAEDWFPVWKHRLASIENHLFLIGCLQLCLQLLVTGESFLIGGISHVTEIDQSLLCQHL